MNTPAGIVEAQLRALIDRVEQHREAHCRTFREEADGRCRQLLADAHAEARTRMHRAVEEERQRTRIEKTAARAQLQTRARQNQYRIALGLLQEGWEKLREAIRQRWDDRTARRQWIRALIDEALVVLPGGVWRIEHPASWQPSEIDEELARVRDYCGHEPELLARDDLDAGLRFCVDGATLDGSTAGLLTDRTGIEARLLAEVNRLLGDDALSGPPQLPSAPGGREDE